VVITFPPRGGVYASTTQKHALSSQSSWPPSLSRSRLVVSHFIPFLYVINHYHAQQSFENVPITADGVETISFLEAADGLMDLFGEFTASSLQPYPRSKLNTFDKISWAVPSLHLSKQTSETTSRSVYFRLHIHPTPPFFFSNAQHLGGPRSV